MCEYEDFSLYSQKIGRMMTEKQILEQLKRKYEAEMVSALVGAGLDQGTP